MAEIKLCCDLEKTPTETDNCGGKNQKKVKLVYHIVFKLNRQLSDGKDCLQDDMREGRSSFRDCIGLRNKVCN